ncbi:MAG: P-II family nitrogen regulator [Gemmatimonas sp.]
MNDQAMIEVCVARENAERVAAALMEAANNAALGDGIVAILPVQKVYCVRTRSAAMPNAECW